MSKTLRFAKLAKTINSFKDEASDAYIRLVPDLRINQKGLVENFSDLTNVMVGEGYTKLHNEFLTHLINKIGLSFIVMQSSANPLSIFKKGSLPYGSDVEAIFTNPAIAEDIGAVSDANQQKLLKTYKPDTKAVILRTNRGASGLGDVYSVTSATEDIKRAFQSIENMDNYITSLVKSLVSGDEIDEFKYTKKIIDNAVASNLIKIQPVTVDVESEASLKSLVAKMRARFLKFTLPSTLNNAYTHWEDSEGNPCVVMSQREDICLIIKSDILANIDVAVLAAAFNMEKADFLGRVVVVDQFENEGILAVLLDQSWLQIYESEKTIEDFRNARTGTTNTFLRARGTFAALPFANAVAFVTNDEDFMPSIPATAIVPEDVTVEVGKTYNFRLTPANATEVVTVDPEDVGNTAAIEINNDNKTFKVLDAGSVTIFMEGNTAVEVTITAS